MEGHGTTHELGVDQSDRHARSLSDTALPDSVLRAVTEELVSRIARKIPAERPALSSLLAPAPEAELNAFCDALIAPDPAKAGQFFDRLRERGKTPDALTLCWIAEAARTLGDRWVADTCGFLDVTLGLSRLHGLQRSLQSAFVPDSSYQPPELSALFSPVPGETHVLGVTMTADFFRRAGWQVDLHCEPDLESLCQRAKVGNYRLIGLSAGCLSVRDSLQTSVQRLRTALPGVKIVLGGYIGELDPDIKEQVNVDHVFAEGVTAPLLCQKLVFPEDEAVLGSVGWVV